MAFAVGDPDLREREEAKDRLCDPAAEPVSDLLARARREIAASPEDFGGAGVDEASALAEWFGSAAEARAAVELEADQRDQPQVVRPACGERRVDA